jgi:hypothetical protein
MNLFQKTFDFIKTIDSFYKETKDIEFTPFVDKNDIEIYRDHNTLQYTKLLIKRILKRKNINHPTTLLHYMIVCYILSIKVYTDCFISSKPYTYIIQLLDMDIIKLSQLITLEENILKEFDYKI